MGDPLHPTSTSATDAQVRPPVDVGLNPGNDSLIGRVFGGRYRIEERLGAGGMGTVYRANQEVVNRAVALKVLHGQSALDEREVARFRQEARAVASLRHPHTVSLIDYGETEDGVFYLVMELVEGRTLREVLSNEAPLPLSRAIHILSQMAESLAEAHAGGIVHRDLKPSNVLLTEIVGRRDFVKVVDFGIAKVTGPAAAPMRLTGTGLAIGSPRFMSPEQVAAMPVSPRSDLYALGAIFYEMITGRPLFEHMEATQYLIAHLEEAPAWPSVAGESLAGDAVELCMQCLSKQPSERPLDALEVLHRLQMAAAMHLLDEHPKPLVDGTDSYRDEALNQSARERNRPEIAPEFARDTQTTRRESALARPEALLLPGQHLAVPSSPTVANFEALLPEQDKRGEVVTLLESERPRSVRPDLQTGVPRATERRGVASDALHRGVRSVARRPAWPLTVLLLVAVALATRAEPEPVSQVEPSPAAMKSEPLTPPVHEQTNGAPSSASSAKEVQAVERYLMLVSEPSGALVLVDGEPVGETPIRLPQTRLEALIELRKEGHHASVLEPGSVRTSERVTVRMRARD